MVSVVDSGILKENQIYHGSEYLWKTFIIKLWHSRSCEVLLTWPFLVYSKGVLIPYYHRGSLPRCAGDSWCVLPKANCVHCFPTLCSVTYILVAWIFDILKVFIPWKWAYATSQLELVVKPLPAHQSWFSASPPIVLLIALFLACC